MRTNEQKVLHAMDIAHEAGYNLNVDIAKELLNESRSLDRKVSPIFNGLEFNNVIHDAIAKSSVPEGHQGALVLVVDELGTRAIIAAKVGNYWEIRGKIDHP